MQNEHENSDQLGYKWHKVVFGEGPWQWFASLNHNTNSINSAKKLNC